MPVVADTSPINYLVLIQHEAILPALYERVVIPPAVLDAGAKMLLECLSVYTSGVCIKVRASVFLQR
jgi:predicted nucleic acid-binding protein